MAGAKRKHYLYAANWLKKAKRAYTQLGQSRAWQAYPDQLHERYKRRPALQEHLRRV